MESALGYAIFIIILAITPALMSLLLGLVPESIFQKVKNRELVYSYVLSAVILVEFLLFKHFFF